MSTLNKHDISFLVDMLRELMNPTAPNRESCEMFAKTVGCSFGVEDVSTFVDRTMSRASEIYEQNKLKSDRAILISAKLIAMRDSLDAD